MWDKKDVNNFVSAESGVGAGVAPLDHAQLPDAPLKSLFRICFAQEHFGSEFNSFIARSATRRRSEVRIREEDSSC